MLHLHLFTHKKTSFWVSSGMNSLETFFYCPRPKKKFILELCSPTLLFFDRAIIPRSLYVSESSVQTAW